MYGSWYCVVGIDDFRLIYLGIDSAEAMRNHVEGETVYVASERMGDAQRLAGMEAAVRYVERTRRER